MTYEEYKKWLDGLIRSVSSDSLDGFLEDGESIVLESDYGRVSLTRNGNEVRAKPTSDIGAEVSYRLDKGVLSDSTDSKLRFE